MRLVEIRLMDWGGVDGGKEVVGRGMWSGYGVGMVGLGLIEPYHPHH